MQKIMFNDKYQLTKAVLEGRKTQTRRICKYSRPDESYDIVFPIFEPKDYDDEGNNTSALNYAFGWGNDEGMFTGWNKPYYKVGEIVAIAQRYADIGIEPFPFCEAGWQNKMRVRADLMPHQIKVTNIRIRRLQDISDEDCLAEGVVKSVHNIPTQAPQSIVGYYPSLSLKEAADKVGWGHTYSTPQYAYAALIDKVSGKGTWESNPWVFVYEFELVK